MTVEIERWGKWKIAWVSTTNLKEVAHLIESNAIDGIGINQHNQKGATPDLLYCLPSPKGLALTDVEGQNLAPISNVVELRFLALGQKRTSPIDFSKYQQLVDLNISFHKNDKLPVANSKLSVLNIASYKPATRDFSQLEPYTSLTVLELVQPSIHNVNGIEKLKALRKLGLHYCRSLTSLSAISASQIEYLDLSSCTKVETFEVH
jgi:hypothetical protein